MSRNMFLDDAIEEISRLRSIEVDLRFEVERLKAREITDEQIDAAWNQVRWFREQNRNTEADNIEAVLSEMGIVECGCQKMNRHGLDNECASCHGHGWIREERGDE